MATLKNSVIDNLNVSGKLQANSTFELNDDSYVSVDYASNTNYSNTGPIPFNQTYVNKNINVQNNGSRYTILKEGLYYCCYHNISDSNDGGVSRTRIYINGSNRSQARGDRDNVSYPMVLAIALQYMNVGDYFEMVHTNDTIYLTRQYNDFSIQRIR